MLAARHDDDDKCFNFCAPLKVQVKKAPLFFSERNYTSVSAIFMILKYLERFFKYQRVSEIICGEDALFSKIFSPNITGAYNTIKIEGYEKAPFSIATTLKCRWGRNSFPWIALLTMDPHLIMVSVKQGGIKHHFEFLLWLNPRLNPGLQHHWRTLYYTWTKYQSFFFSG